MKACLKYLIVVVCAVAFAASASFAGTYTNEKRGFSFEYPERYSVKAESENRIAVIDSKGNTALTAEVEDIKHYPTDLYAGYSDPFEKFGTWRAMLRCDADGPDGSAYCPSLKSTEQFRTRNGFRALELMLVHVSETFGEKPSREEKVTGPLYLVDISREKHTVVLMLGASPEKGLTDKQKKLAGSILDSVKFTK